MEADFEVFHQALLRATERIAPDFLQFPIAGQEEPIHRERVYAYEIYRLIRENLPVGYPYTLSPEVDKAGHPLLQKLVGPLKPDFILHVPGSMDRNLAVMEVKHVSATEDATRKDVHTLRAFLEKAGYLKAVHLIYGDCSRERFARFQQIHTEILCDFPRGRVLLLWHRNPGHPAANQAPLA